MSNFSYIKSIGNRRGEKTFSWILIAISISIGIGPLFLLALSPNRIIEAERLQIDSFITPFFIVVLFLFAILYGKLGQYVVKTFKQIIPLFLLWLILLISSILYSKVGTNTTLNLSFLGAIFFYVTSKGVMEEYPHTIARSLKAYVYTCGIVSVVYLFLIGSPFTFVSNGRFFFLGENPNSYSTRLAASIICTLFILEKKNYKRNILLLGLIITQLIIIYLSGSRGAIFMLVIGALVYYLSTFKHRNKKLTNTLTLMVPTIIFGVIIINNIDINLEDTSMSERLSAFFTSNETGGRLDLWKDTFYIFENNPLIGVGSDGFTREMQLHFGEHRDAHNLFLYILTTSGVIGFIFFLFFLIPLTVKAYRHKRFQAYSITLLALMYFVAFKSGGVLAYSLMWFMFAIASALLNTAGKTQLKNSYRYDTPNQINIR